MTTPRSRLMALFTVLAVFGVGVAIGVAADRSLLRRQSDGSRERRGGGRPFSVMGEPQDTSARNRMRSRIVKRMTDELTLTPAQAQQVDAIFATNERQLDSLRAQVGPRLDSLRHGMQIAIDSVLTPAQRVKATAMRAKWRERHRHGAGDRERRSGDGR